MRWPRTPSCILRSRATQSWGLARAGHSATRHCPKLAKFTPSTCCNRHSARVSAALWVMEGNTPARRFYQRLGGREIVRREQQREGFSAVGIAYGWEDLNSLI